MSANYDNSAWFYDRLSQMVYGKALFNAQVYLLRFIKPWATVLIVGGGTGWILEEITRIHSATLTITYVEVSAQMMALSRKRNTGNNRVNFINAPIEYVPLSVHFDTIITPFLFDNFTDATMRTVFAHLHPMLKQDGVWLNTDFQLKGKWWQTVLLSSMLLFFKVICNIEASALPDIDGQFELYGYSKIEGKTFFGEFVSSKVYQKFNV